MFKKLIEEYTNALETAKTKYIGKMQEDYSGLSDDDCIELLEEYGDEISDILAVYPNYQRATIETAFSLGYVTKENEQYFDYESFEQDLRSSDNYIELSSGKVVYVINEIIKTKNFHLLLNEASTDASFCHIVINPLLKRKDHAL